MSTRLDDRRAVLVGPRFHATWTEDGLYPAMGFHTRGEMGGLWSPPIKLLDGIWFRLDGAWLGDGVDARRFASGWGYTRTTYAERAGLRTERTDLVPRSLRAGLVELTLRSDSDRVVRLAVDAHSELMLAYPWGETDPSQLTFNRRDTGATTRGALAFRESVRLGAGEVAPHRWATVVGSRLDPVRIRLGEGYRGPQQPPVICPPSGTDDEQPPRCDDTAYGKGTGGRLVYRVPVTAGEPRTVWFAVAGSDKGLHQAQVNYSAALLHPTQHLTAELKQRREVARRTDVRLPGDRLLQRSVTWSKQNLVDSVQTARDLQLRWVDAGTRYPPVEGVLKQARWLGAGWPDYPWIFGTDGEYTAFASVAMGQFGPIKAHLRALRDVSRVINGRTGKVVHEVTPDGAVYFGANEDEGNTDETSKFPSAVALVWRWTGDDAFRDEMYGFMKRGMHYVVDELDDDRDGWPEGLGNVEREGMGEEKLDNTVYTIRGLRDLADMARSRGDEQTARWATTVAERMERRFEAAWWYGRDGAPQYADSLDGPDNRQVFQRHWIGVTPMDAVLSLPGQPDRPLSSQRHGDRALDERELDCYTGRFGLYHTGTGPTSDPGGNPGPSCDRVVSTVPSERNVFSLNTAIMAVAEGNFGRLGPDQQQYYTTGNARIQLDPQVWEMPGAMPEIAPEGDFEPNIDRLFTERSMVLQAWGAYGTLWPVVHHQLGVSPHLPRGRVAVVPQVPAGQHEVAGRNIRLGPKGSVGVRAVRRSDSVTTAVDLRAPARLVIGHVLPAGKRPATVLLDGLPVPYEVRRTARGRELVVLTGPGAHRLVISFGPR